VPRELLETRAGRSAVLAVAVLALGVAAGLIVLWPGAAGGFTVPLGAADERAEVLAVERADCPQAQRSPCQEIARGSSRDQVPGPRRR
jgi:hypothetical protein